MIRDAIQYPKRRDDALATILVGGLLNLTGFLILPQILLYGYYLRVLESAASGGSTAPAFDEWADLFVDGLKAFGVAVVYTGVPVFLLVLIPAVMTFVLPMGSPAGAGTGGQPAAGSALALLMIGLSIVSFGLLAVGYYLLPAALTGLALKGTLDAAFDASALKRVALSKEYFVGCVAAAALLIGASVVLTPLLFLLVGFFLQFYVLVSATYLVGHSVGAAAVA